VAAALRRWPVFFTRSHPRAFDPRPVAAARHAGPWGHPHVR